MNERILTPGLRRGRVRAPASKSMAHRLALCAALSPGQTRLACGEVCGDIAAMLGCLAALGARVDTGTDARPGGDPAGERASGGYVDARAPGEIVIGGGFAARGDGLAVLDCGESASALRFLLPLVGALGAGAEFRLRGRLPERPIAPLEAVLRAHGMRIDRAGARLIARGRLAPGGYEIAGSVSSQYVTGLLLALPLLAGESRLRVTGPEASRGYVAMTEAALRLAGIRFGRAGREYRIPGGQRYAMPARAAVEGDWSAAAFFLCMGALSREGVAVDGLATASLQGDRRVLDILRRMGAQVTQTEGGAAVRRGGLRGARIDCADIPDLAPALAAVAAFAEGETRFVRAERLRYKESDRVGALVRMIRAIGGAAARTEDGLTVSGRPSLPGGAVDPCGDHRVAMAAAVAACGCAGPVALADSACVAKSYPRFWEDFAALEEEAT